jgi:formylglycine-generating enzyme required for sulfatase activity
MYGPTDDHFPYSAPVGSFVSGRSPCGAMDMAGNVDEWCADVFKGRDAAAPAPGDPTVLRVVRGGSWDEDSSALRLSARRGKPESSRHRAVGFRGVTPAAGVPLLDAPE